MTTLRLHTEKCCKAVLHTPYTQALHKDLAIIAS
jgi:hypothetical protein